MSRIYLWLLRRRLEAVLRERAQFLDVQREWWRAMGVELDYVVPSRADLIVSLVGYTHRENTEPWRQQVEFLTLVDEIRVVSGDPEASRIL